MNLLTMSTESRAAMATKSAHETTPGHTLSTADLMLSTTSNPRAELRFGAAFFSPVKDDVSSKRIEPSQPCSIHRASKIMTLYKSYFVTIVMEYLSLD